MTKYQAMKIHALVYTVCYDISNKTKSVDRVLKQIRTGLKKMQHKEYTRMAHEVHKEWEVARKKVFADNDGEIFILISEFLMTLYNAIPEKYQNIYYSDKNFTRMVNSFIDTKQNIDDNGECTQK